MSMDELSYVGSAPRVRRRTKMRAKTRTKGASAAFVMVCAAFFILLALLLYRETEVTVLTKEIAELEERREETLAKRDAVLRELSPYMTQNRVEKIARDALEMDYPTAKQTMRVAVEGGAPALHEEEKTEETQENVIARILALLFDGRDKV